MSDPTRELKKWENGINTWDFQKETAKANKDFLSGFGRDQLTYKPEKITLENEFWRYNEASWSHGYPATSWLQLAIMYGCGLYTAQ